MWLDLGGHSHFIQESLVIHQFGHALGLEHEHLRSEFRDIFKKLLDEEKIKSDPHFTKEFFDINIGTSDTKYLSEYDPMSIMHYW